MNNVVLKDCLDNCCVDNTRGTFGENQNPALMYARGVIVGMLSAFIAGGSTFEEALTIVKKNVRSDNGAHGVFDVESIPTHFLDEWYKD